MAAAVQVEARIAQAEALGVHAREARPVGERDLRGRGSEGAHGERVDREGRAGAGENVESGGAQGG
eukprot:6205435-Pleurochrysis_carterae.AAC.3